MSGGLFRVSDGSFKQYVRNYPLYFLLWTVVAIFQFTKGFTQRLGPRNATPWWHYLAVYAIGDYIWALLTPAILWLGRRFPLERNTWLPVSILHLILAAGFSVFELSLLSAVLTGVHLFPSPLIRHFHGALTLLIVNEFHAGVLDYWIVLGIQWGVLYYLRYRVRSQEVLQFELQASELKSQLVSAQLNALKMQLQPHFLFNTLNAIAVLVRQQKSRDAEQMLGHLSDLLRGVLEDVDAQEVSLRRELEYLGLYLSIERVRFADRLRVEILADPATQNASVPQLILQPIVENAIRHGIGRSSSASRILISATKLDSMVEVRVQDDGPGLPKSYSPQLQGVGLTNTRARLRQLYGEDGNLEIEDCDSGGVIVTLKFPFNDFRRETVSVYGS